MATRRTDCEATKAFGDKRLGHPVWPKILPRKSICVRPYAESSFEHEHHSARACLHARAHTPVAHTPTRKDTVRHGNNYACTHAHFEYMCIASRLMARFDFKRSAREENCTTPSIVLAYMHVSTHICLHTRLHTCQLAHTCTSACTRECTHARTRERTHARARARTNACTHARACIARHACIPARSHRP